MFKFVVLTLVLVWFLGLFLGKRRRFIRDVHQLLGFIIWAGIAFVGLTAFSDTRPLGDSVVAQLLLTLLWLALSWVISRFIIKFLIR